MKIASCILLLALGMARADIRVRIDFEPLPAEFKPLEAVIRDHVAAAMREWARHFRTRDSTIHIAFAIRDWPARGAGRSIVSAPLGKMHQEKHLTEEGAARKLRTGSDPNGNAPDIEIFFDPAYFRTLWFDPDPNARTAPMPEPDRQMLDAYSVILHELGHAIGFNGFRNPETGTLPGDHLSAYDRWVTFDGDNFFFNGPNAVKLHGKPVLLSRTNTNYHHLGDAADPAAAPELSKDLMNGITLEWSRRYFISPLDIAILADCGLTPKSDPAAGRAREAR